MLAVNRLDGRISAVEISELPAGYKAAWIALVCVLLFALVAVAAAMLKRSAFRAGRPLHRCAVAGLPISVNRLPSDTALDKIAGRANPSLSRIKMTPDSILGRAEILKYLTVEAILIAAAQIDRALGGDCDCA